MHEIDQALTILKNDDVVAIPTETVYGLAASIESPQAVEKIFQTKERPFFDPLIVHVCSIEQAKTYAKEWYEACDILTQNFWPGPLTIVLPKANFLNPMITSGLDSVGLRMPAHSMTLELIEKLGHPLAAPSANKFKKTSPTKAEHVKAEFPDLFVLDGGACNVGIESTVVGVFRNKISLYRPGMITKSQIEKVLAVNELEIPVEEVSSPVAPGQLKHHYMPKIPIILKYTDKDITELNTDFIPPPILEHPQTIHLDKDPALCARNLYQNFRNHSETSTCLVITINPELCDKDDWSGIVNRLEKAASFLLTK